MLGLARTSYLHDSGCTRPSLTAAWMDNGCMAQPTASSFPNAARPAANLSPTLPLMHAAFVLAGLGTMLIGPILPILAARWHLRDSQSGLLLLAQFCGATLGGATVSSRLSRDLLIGLAAAAAGFFVFAFAPGFLLACTGLIVGGFGVGRTIATINILAGLRARQQRGSALSRLNFSWSFGALLSPLLAAWLTPHFALRTLLAAFAVLFLGVFSTLLLQRRRQSEAAEGAPGASAEYAASATAGMQRVFAYFLLMLFLYGGLETCLSGWLTTYALRFGQTSLVLSEYTMVLLLAGLTAGRALAARLLLKMEDTTLLRIALALTALLAVGLALAQRSSVMAACAVLLGVCLAPVFPASFSIYMSFRPPARQAGLVLAASGIGAASLPWGMGVISTHAGSLRVALALPVAVALAMLAQSSFGPARSPHANPEAPSRV